MAEEKEAAEGGEKPAGGGKKKLIIIIIVVVLVLVLGGVGAFFALGGSKGEGEEGGEEEAEAEAEANGEEGAAGELPGAIFPLEVFIVNLSVKGSFLKTSIQLEFVEPMPPPSLENDIPRIRDAIIRVLSSKTAADLLGSEGKETLREEVKEVVNDTLGADDVSQIYFTEFIIQ